MGENMNEEKKSGILKTTAKVLISVIGIWAVMIVALEIAFSSSLTTRLVNKIASEYIDGEVGFGKASCSFFKNFPSPTISLDDFSVTYPADRFDALEKKGPQGHLLYMGCGQDADTLASFRNFTARIHLAPLLLGKVRVPEIELTRPRIYAHSYDQTNANWNIFIADTVQTDDTAATLAFPDISIGTIRLSDRPRIVYTDSRDTVFAMINLRKAGFDGRLNTEESSRNRIGLSLDSMFVAGRIAEDTLALNVERLGIHEHHDHIDIGLSARTMVATRTFGRMHVPVEMSATVHMLEDSIPAIGIHNFMAEIAAVPFTGKADLRFLDDRTDIDASLSVKECKADEIIRKFVRNFIPEAADISTDAIISVDATCKGEYVHGSGRLPVFRVDLLIPESKVRHKDIGKDLNLALDAYIANTRRGSFNLTLNDIGIKTYGLSVNAYGNVKDILSDDPSFSIDGSMAASLDSLMTFLPDAMGISAHGRLDAAIQGSANLSHMSLYTFSQSSLTGQLKSEKISIHAPDDSLDVQISGIDMNLGPEERASRRDSTHSIRLMGITGNISKLSASYGKSLAAEGEKIVISAKNSASGIDTTQVNRLSGMISADKLAVTDAEGARIDLSQTSNRFHMMPKRENHKVPVLSLSSTNKRIALAADVNRAILTDASIKARAEMNTVERRQRMNERMDSLQRVYPDIPRDSLLSHARAKRPSRQVPEWMKEDDFRKRDINIELDQSLAKYFREWDLSGDVDIRTGIIMTPYLPLRNILRGLDISFNNDRIAVDSLKVMTGTSSIAAKGELSGLRRMLGGRSRSGAVMNLNMEFNTEKMNANELLAAYNAGSNFNPEDMKDQMEEASDAEFLQMVINDSLSESDETKLLVIPANLNADIRLKGKKIRYSSLNISELNANLLMKERCVQITNTMATSNIGEVSFEGFYATRSKKDIKAGFNFGFKDITADKAIELMPSVDSIMPLLKSFGGQLNCDFAATASLDTNMNVITPSINGVLRISGDDLTITDSDMFTSLARKLKFDNSKTGKIEKMTVEGVIKDNVLEVFPFVVKLDRYTLALSGKQNLDMSYRYHASLIKSPMVIRVGVDLYGSDFDHMKFKIGKPKYKSEKVPVFTAVIDETRINLAESIRGIFEKGVDAAVIENEKQAAIDELKQEIGYVNAVDQETEELSEEEQKQLEGDTAPGTEDTEETVDLKNNIETTEKQNTDE